MPEALPPGYYLDNFTFLLDHVGRQYGDILSQEESAFATEFDALSGAARRLYVRMASRKGPLFRSDKLNYPEIADIPAAADELIGAGYADRGEDADMADLLALLTKQELLQLDAGIDLDRNARREQLVEALLESLVPADVVRQCPFTIWRPLRVDLLQVYKLLFFGNLNQDFTEFVLHDLGITPFEQYPINREQRFFEDRALMEQTLSLYALRDEAQEAVESGDPDEMHTILDRVPSVDELASERLLRRRDRLVNHVARQLEREGQCEQALAAYEQCRAAPARERRARIHDRLGDIDAAMRICRDIIEAPEDEAEYEFAARFLARLCKKSRVALPAEAPQPGNDDVDIREISVRFDPAVKVEWLAHAWFEDAGHEAWYVENGLLPGLFGIVFWDIIFVPVDGAFHHPFQRGPADLFTADFYEARRSLIDQRLLDIRDSRVLRELIESRFEEKRGLANHFVDWRVLEPPLIDRTLARMPLEHLLSVFERMLRDLKRNCSGFPDLAVFPPTGGYILSEVKGPSDTLQNNQKRWLRHFQQVGMPAEVVKVSWL